MTAYMRHQSLIDAIYVHAQYIYVLGVCMHIWSPTFLALCLVASYMLIAMPQSDAIYVKVAHMLKKVCICEHHIALNFWLIVTACMLYLCYIDVRPVPLCVQALLFHVWYVFVLLFDIGIVSPAILEEIYGRVKNYTSRKF